MAAKRLLCELFDGASFCRVRFDTVKDGLCEVEEAQGSRKFSGRILKGYFF